MVGVISWWSMLGLLVLNLGFSLRVCHERKNGAGSPCVWHNGGFGTIHHLQRCCAPMAWPCQVRKAQVVELALPFSLPILELGRVF